MSRLSRTQLITWFLSFPWTPKKLEKVCCLAANCCEPSNQGNFVSYIYIYMYIYTWRGAPPSELLMKTYCNRKTCENENYIECHTMRKSESAGLYYICTSVLLKYGLHNAYAMYKNQSSQSIWVVKIVDYKLLQTVDYKVKSERYHVILMVMFLWCMCDLYLRDQWPKRHYLEHVATPMRLKSFWNRESSSVGWQWHPCSHRETSWPHSHSRRWEWSNAQKVAAPWSVVSNCKHRISASLKL